MCSFALCLLQEDSTALTSITSTASATDTTRVGGLSSITASSTAVGSFSKVGDTVTVTISAGESGLEAGTSSSPTINGVIASGFTDNGDNSYQWTYTLSEGDADWAANELPVSLSLQDAVGHVSPVFTTPPSTAGGDANTPVITGLSAAPASGTRKVGDEVEITITVDDGPSDTGMRAGTGSLSTVNGDASLQFEEDGNGRYTYTCVQRDRSFLRGA